jgi:hypothetical protein
MTRQTLDPEKLIPNLDYMAAITEFKAAEAKIAKTKAEEKAAGIKEATTKTVAEAKTKEAAEAKQQSVTPLFAKERLAEVKVDVNK